MFSEETVKMFQSYFPQGLTPDECWIWQGKDLSGGVNYPHILRYGRFKNSETTPTRIYAHRFAWMLANNQLIPKGKVICHRCDTPLCVNPSHLFLGTHKENTADMMHKQRQSGQFVAGRDTRRRDHDEHPMAKLTQMQADEIRALYASTRHLSVRASERHSFASLAKRYGVSKKTIINIVYDRIWVVDKAS